MRAKAVFENIEFQRGKDPKKAMDIGINDPYRAFEVAKKDLAQWGYEIHPSTAEGLERLKEDHYTVLWNIPFYNLNISTPANMREGSYLLTYLKKSKSYSLYKRTIDNAGRNKSKSILHKSKDIADMLSFIKSLRIEYIQNEMEPKVKEMTEILNKSKKSLGMP